MRINLISDNSKWHVNNKRGLSLFLARWTTVLYTKRIKSLFLGHWKIEEMRGNSHHASYVCTLSPSHSKNIETSVLSKQTQDSSIH